MEEVFSVRRGFQGRIPRMLVVERVLRMNRRLQGEETTDMNPQGKVEEPFEDQGGRRRLHGALRRAGRHTDRRQSLA